MSGARKNYFGNTRSKSGREETLELRNRVASQKGIDFFVFHRAVVVDREPKEASTKLKCEPMILFGHNNELLAVGFTAGYAPEQIL